MLKTRKTDRDSYSQNKIQEKWSQSQQFVPNDSQQYSFGQFLKNQKLRKRKQKIQYFKKVKSAGFWTLTQNKLYIEFLRQNKESFMSQKCKRSSKIFIKMAPYIKTRSSFQCRSHHQKLSASYQDIDSLIETLSSKIENEQSIKDGGFQVIKKEVPSNEKTININRAGIKQIDPFTFRPILIVRKPTLETQCRNQGYRVYIKNENINVWIDSSWVETY